MAKPIAVVYLPEFLNAGAGKAGWQLARELTEAYELKMPDYYWFVILDFETLRVELKVFHEKDFTDIQYAELKQIIEDSINKIPQ